jgi:N-acetylneuraminate lyase
LTVEERGHLARRWCQVSGGNFPVIVQVGAQSLVNCRAMAAQAQKDGATAISCVAPSYFKPATPLDLVEFCSLVAAVAPALPFYYYHIPMRTGLTFPLLDILRLAADRIPTLAGAKFSHPDLMDYLRCLHLDAGRFEMLYGLDEMLLPALALGARGAVGTTYNFAAPLYRRLMASFEKSDLESARLEQRRSAELIACLNRYDFMPAAKSLMRMIGLDCGPVRLPLRSLTPESEERMNADLKGLGYFAWGRR